MSYVPFLFLYHEVGDQFKAAVHPVNAFQIPIGPAYAAHVGGTAVAPVDQQQKLREQTRQRHSAAVKALAESFGLSGEDVHVREGHPNKVIPEIAETLEADLIVLGATSLGRLDR